MHKVTIEVEGGTMQASNSRTPSTLRGKFIDQWEMRTCMEDGKGHRRYAEKKETIRSSIMMTTLPCLYGRESGVSKKSHV